MPKFDIVRAASNNLLARVFIRSSASTTGAGLTGLTSASASLQISVARELDATTTNYTQAGSTIETITTLGTYAAPTATKIRFKEYDATNWPGMYEIQFAQALIGTGDASRFITGLIFGAANVAPTPFEIELTAVNTQSATAFITSVATVTTVTNQLTAAQVATGVWQDTTAGDFTTALSVGKSVMNGVALGTGLTIASVSGAVGSVTGLTASNLDVAVSSRMATYTQPTGFLAATFPGSVASPTNITAGVITTVTNLTNAPTSGDFTAVMKTSLNAATPVATLSGDFSATMKTSLNASTPASITGAVGSVAGNVVGSVGSVLGAVGSVTGAVGSVAGNVGGNVIGSVASVTAGVTVTTNNDKAGYALSATGSAALTESYAADGAAATLPQLLYMTLAMLSEFSITGTTLTAKRLDGSTTAGTFTLNDSVSPTGITRAT